MSRRQEERMAVSRCLGYSLDELDRMPRYRFEAIVEALIIVGTLYPDWSVGS